MEVDDDVDGRGESLVYDGAKGAGSGDEAEMGYGGLGEEGKGGEIYRGVKV